MKKSIVSLLLAAALLLAGCTAPSSVSTGSGDAPSVVDIPATVSTALPGPTAGDVAETQSASIEERVGAMSPVLCALARVLGIDGTAVYAESDAALVWRTLGEISAACAGTETRITRESDALVVPEAILLTYARAAFGLHELPVLPAELAESISSADGGSYRFALSDPAETELSVSRFALLADGTVEACVSEYRDSLLLGSVNFILESDSESVFSCTVRSAQAENAATACWLPVDPGVAEEADLDGDGVNETVQYTADTEANAVNLTIAYGGEAYTADFEYLYNPSVRIADTDASDGLHEVYLCGDSGSDDYETHVYRLKDGQVAETVLYGEASNVDGTGRITLETPIDVLGSWGGLCDYAFNSADFTFSCSDDYRFFQYIGAWADRKLTLQKDGLPITAEGSSETAVLNAGETLLPLASDLKSFVLCERPDGSRVTLSVSENTDSWGWNVSGAPEADWFGELMYAG